MFLNFSKNLYSSFSHTGLLHDSKRLFHASLKLHTRMKNAYVSHQEDAEQFQVTLQFTNPVLGVDRQFNFNRQMSENVSDFLCRITSSFDKTLAKHLKKTKKRKSDPSKHPGDHTIEVNAELILNGEVVPGSTICRDVIPGCTNLCLRVFGTEYLFIFNAPWVNTITLPSSLMAGFFICPNKLELSYAVKEDCKFTWYKSASPENTTSDVSDWVEVGKEYMYTPRAEDIGCRLKLMCVPACGERLGPMTEVITKGRVEAGPGACPFEERHDFTKERLQGGDRFRVVSYNILADLYADSEVARQELYPYCPAYALHIDYRKQLIMKELTGYNADIICLQEVDAKVYDLDLQPIFLHFGFQSVYHKKAGQVSEGLTCLFHSSKFKLVESHNKYLAEDLTTSPVFSDIWEAIGSHEPLVTRFMNRNTCLQVVVLDSLLHPDERLVIGNTHLYFHPDADHIRLLQAGMVVRHMQDIAAASAVDGKRVSVVMCGDFNSTPECGVFQLMTTQYVAADCVDWNSTASEAVSGVSLSHSLLLGSACGTPPFTNFTVGFSGCLDYVFYQRDRLDVTQVLPMPSVEDVTLHTALPSVVFPSDHVAQVADLQLRNVQQAGLL